jgi:hypothetical protein
MRRGRRLPRRREAPAVAAEGAHRWALDFNANGSAAWGLRRASFVTVRGIRGVIGWLPAICAHSTQHQEQRQRRWLHRAWMPGWPGSPSWAVLRY